MRAAGAAAVPAAVPASSFPQPEAAAGWSSVSPHPDGAASVGGTATAVASAIAATGGLLLLLLSDGSPHPEGEASTLRDL